MSEKVCAESGREALAVRLERIEATIKERVEDGTFVPAMTPADPGKSIGDALVRAVRSGAHQVEFHAGAYDLGYGYKEGCLTAIRPALDEVGEHCVEYYDFDSGEWHGHRTNMGMTVPRFRFPDVQDEVEAAAPAPGAAPADLVGEQVVSQ